MGNDDTQDTMKLSTGVVLKLRNPSPIVMATAIEQVADKEPKPPTVFIEAKGREEENPSDPDYLQARQAWLATTGLRALRALIPTGSALMSKPEDVVGPEDEDYPDLMASMGIEPGTGRYTRYVQWILHVACSGRDDIGLLSTTLMRRAGVREEDVAEAQALFPGLAARGTDRGVSP